VHVQTLLEPSLAAWLKRRAKGRELSVSGFLRYLVLREKDGIAAATVKTGKMGDKGFPMTKDEQVGKREQKK